ncbi:MAG: Malonyl CoA acyl carrier protein transacylase [Solirubrobacterales bacterium]|jgi:malonate decarboxylase epsilon subunit|nr:Malonyl CoA acyl carrier protein transacylase [Solirubrobacterales bacterium]
MGARRRTALLFEDVGSQYPGMLAALGEGTDVAETLTESAGPLEHVIAHGLAGLDSERSLAGTVGAQLALLVGGVAAGRAAVAASGPPSAVAGCGVGVFSAAVVAGVLRLDEAIRMVHLRARMMARLFPAPDGMAVVYGLSPEHAGDLAGAVGSVAAPLWLARVDSPEESVLAGSGDALELLAERAPAAGAHRVEPLAGAAPCHGPALRPVAAALTDALLRVPDRRPTVPSVGNVSGDLLSTSTAVRADLALGVARTVHWHDAIAVLIASGVETLVPTMPGGRVARLADRYPGVDVARVGELPAVAGRPVPG